MRFLPLLLLMGVLIAIPNDGHGSSRWKKAPASACRDTLNLDFETLLAESYSGFDETMRGVFNDGDDFEKFWRKAHSQQMASPERPEFDRSRQLVIAAGMGRQHSGGYAISIVKVLCFEDRLIVHVRELSPGPDCTVTRALTAPVVAILVEAEDKQVEFVETKGLVDCK
jgi:hypothetical protein